MEDYTLVERFDNLHQAELRKDILTKNDIDAFIVNKRDYLFFIGYIELYTKKKDEKKAKQLLQEFKGLTKINSFVVLKPILLFQKILQKDGIQCKIKNKEDDKYLLNNYELYVNNEDAEKVVPYLTGEKLKGWSELKSFNKVRQTQIHTELLDANQIDAISIKKKDSDFHLQELVVYVRNEDLERAKALIDSPEGFVVLRKAENYTKIEVDEETLAKENIPAIIRKNQAEFDLLVKKDQYEQADTVLLRREEWVVLKSFADMPRAVFYKHLLEQHGIQTVILNEKDHSFLIGDVELYVEETNLEKARNILKNS
jgi:hypothetical protein